MKIRLLVDLPIAQEHGAHRGRVVVAELGRGGRGDPWWWFVSDTGEKVGVMQHEAVVVNPGPTQEAMDRQSMEIEKEEKISANEVAMGEARRKLMAEQWVRFAEMVLPPTCSDVQRREMRRAFYAGGEAILFRVIAALAPENEVTEGDVQIMSDLDQELKDFAKDVAAGKA